MRSAHDQPELPFPADQHYYTAAQEEWCWRCLHKIHVGDDVYWEIDMQVHATCPSS